MNVKSKTKYGTINISNEAIASTVGDAILMCYGVVGIANKASLKSKVNEILKNNNFNKGVFVSQIMNNITIDAYIVVAKNVKISEVLLEVQKQIKYAVKKNFDLDVYKANVYAQSMEKIS